MEKMIVVGNDIFEEFIKDHGYYVDKTELLYELVAKNRNKVTLFTRPRRFGKTLTMSMMESFFDIRRDSRDIFQGLTILKEHPDFCDDWLNQYPVLFLTLKDVEGLNFAEAYSMCQDGQGKAREIARDANYEIGKRVRTQKDYPVVNEEMKRKIKEFCARLCTVKL